ncbi:dihydroneopterin aldolase [Celeribacter ethanolicus]|uniref:7,8-dihydroneopterin aldolase n=1 Tax=Celeribacter ethanolicus TaxID=1758178 RepID=A0A291GED3_9RHOB|nr:dihydroneopterin aldolase [Celeribacter ethanolicus]ATG48913.1 dihydroneopterin aldolase [Celeribacter ethanolicus]TNE63270.1 MAG: dihydroneopterin aldolase [Paracoccaceae bacterium]
MSDRIFLSNLCLYGFHGVMPEEKRLGQRFYIDLSCELDLAPAGQSDDYTRTVCYDALCQLAQEISDNGPFDLIETLGERIAQGILDRFALIRAVRVTVRKPSAPIRATLDHAGIEIRRQR